MAHGSTHVALSTEAESTTSTESESATSARRLRPLSFCQDSLEGFTAYPRYFEQRNYVTYRTAPCTLHHTPPCTQQATPGTQHLARRTTQQSSLIEEFHRKMQNASSTGLPRVPEVIFQRFNILRNIYLSTSTFNFNIYVIIYMIISYVLISGQKVHPLIL